MSSSGPGGLWSLLSFPSVECSPVDRTRMSATNGLRIKLRDMMNDFQALRNRIVTKHKSLKRRYYNATGKVATDEEIDKLVSVNWRGKKQLRRFKGV
ncbi:hypothetical protein IFM89_006016 [Coptis chinensis]|uniref:Syntaxin N-terminal domain-containing protein n=1 Tax=Coptis chinensis TaxID=261450 RepID=A0A835I060_9MAGN|nr:hypothetical protein IFM89_006016 [Coptis chinensis]